MEKSKNVVKKKGVKKDSDDDENETSSSEDENEKKILNLKKKVLKLPINEPTENIGDIKQTIDDIRSGLLSYYSHLYSSCGLDINKRLDLLSSSNVYPTSHISKYDIQNHKNKLLLYDRKKKDVDPYEKCIDKSYKGVDVDDLDISRINKEEDIYKIYNIKDKNIYDGYNIKEKNMYDGYNIKEKNMYDGYNIKEKYV